MKVLLIDVESQHLLLYCLLTWICQDFQDCTCLKTRRSEMAGLPESWEGLLGADDVSWLSLSDVTQEACFCLLLALHLSTSCCCKIGLSASPCLSVSSCQSALECRPMQIYSSDGIIVNCLHKSSCSVLFLMPNYVSEDIFSCICGSYQPMYLGAFKP